MIRLAALLFMLPAVAWAEPAIPIAVFDVELINTSPAPSTPEEIERTRVLGQQLRDALSRSGRYRVVDLAPVRAALDQAPAPRICNGCELPLARQVGARQAAVVWVQKVSNLILNINLHVEDVASGETVFQRSVDIRGNTDLSWRRGATALVGLMVGGAAAGSPGSGAAAQ